MKTSTECKTVQRPKAKEENLTICVVGIKIPFELVSDNTTSQALQRDDTLGTNPLNEVIKTQNVTFVEHCSMGEEKKRL